MTTLNPSAFVDPYLEYALTGDSRPAVALALRLLDGGVPLELIITDLLAAAQRRLGELWQANQLNVADEHLATAVAQTTLHALASTTPAGDFDLGLVVVVCAEGDWHGLAAHMFAEQLRSHSIGVAYLGASTPAEHVARFIDRRRPDALAVSCNLPIFYAGITRLADEAHAQGVPVLVGGRALAADTTARLLGADGWAHNLPGALELLAGWRDRPPPVPSRATDLLNAAIELDAGAEKIASAAFDDLMQQSPAMGHWDAAQLARTREDLAFIVQFVAAAMLVDEPTVLTGFLDWLAELLAARNVPKSALHAGLEMLQPHLTDAGAGSLGTLGLAHLSVPS